jgi:Ran GTPase-activating protein (RanGAP) involved in mRNA processing and transport
MPETKPKTIITATDRIFLDVIRARAANHQILMFDYKSLSNLPINIMEEIATIITSTTTLHTIDLSHCLLSHASTEVLHILGTAIADAKHIKKIDLSNNELNKLSSTNIAALLMPILLTSSQKYHLNLSNNNLFETENLCELLITFLTNLIASSKNLESLDLSNNALGKIPQYLEERIFKCFEKYTSKFALSLKNHHFEYNPHNPITPRLFRENIENEISANNAGNRLTIIVDEDSANSFVQRITNERMNAQQPNSPEV